MADATVSVSQTQEREMAGRASEAARPSLYAWGVLALTIGLMIADYLSRQVIAPAFSFIKMDWLLSDAQLGALVSIVALVTGLFAIPISLLADRWGRVKSVTLMAILWSLATIACGLSGAYNQLLLSRAFVGTAEAGYGGAGGAILAHVFPRKWRSTVFGLFLAGALIGSVLGVLIGGIVSVKVGWRAAFFVVAIPGLVFGLLYGIFVKDYKNVKEVKTDAQGVATPVRTNVATILSHVFPNKSAVFTYLASGFQYMIAGVIVAWMPSFFSRTYLMRADRAAGLAAAIVLMMAIGMFVGGRLTDILTPRNPKFRGVMPALYCLFSAGLLVCAFALPAGGLQLALIFAGAFFVGGHSGVGPAIVTEVTGPGFRATAIATIVLADNLIGLAPGPVLAGALSDRFGLQFALELLPIASLVGAFFYLLASRSYAKDSASFA
jgi:MFS family permease